MTVWYSQRDVWASGDWNDDYDFSPPESDTVDLDYYGLTDEEVAAFNELRRDLYYDIWLEYTHDWD